MMNPCKERIWFAGGAAVLLELMVSPALAGGGVQGYGPDGGSVLYEDGKPRWIDHTNQDGDPEPIPHSNQDDLPPPPSMPGGWLPPMGPPLSDPLSDPRALGAFAEITGGPISGSILPPPEGGGRLSTDYLLSIDVLSGVVASTLGEIGKTVPSVLGDLDGALGVDVFQGNSPLGSDIGVSAAPVGGLNVVPAPGALTLLGLGVLLGRGRRRRT